MRIRTILLALFVVAAVASRAEAKHVRFLGPHPIAAKFGGGYCYIEAPHMHVYGPDRPNCISRSATITSSPAIRRRSATRASAIRSMAITPSWSTARPSRSTASSRGRTSTPTPHRRRPTISVKDGVAFYVAPISPAYVKPARVRVVNAEYRPYVQFRPTVEVAPPPEWHGEVYVGAPGVVVGAPGVDVEVRGPGVFVPPPPHVAVEVSAPGVIVAPPAPHADRRWAARRRRRAGAGHRRRAGRLRR